MGLQLETIKFDAKPSKFRIGFPVVAIYFPKATICGQLFNYKSDLFVLEINVLKLLANRPYLSFSFSGGSFDANFSRSNFRDFVSSLYCFFSNVNSGIQPRKVLLDKVSFGNGFGQLTCLYKNSQKNSWQASLDFLPKGPGLMNSMVLNKNSNILDGKILVGGQTVAQANLIKTLPNSWILCADAKTNWQKGLAIDRKGSKLFVQDQQTGGLIGSVDLLQKTCNLACNLELLKPFVAGIDFAGGNKLLCEFRSAFKEGSGMAVFGCGKAGEKLHQITVCAANNFAQWKISNSMFFVKKILTATNNQWCSFPDCGQLAMGLCWHDKIIGISVNGQNLKIENKTCANKVNSIDFTGVVDFPTKLLWFDRCKIEFDKGSLQLDGSFCQVGSWQAWSELLFLNGKCNEFCLAMPKVCCLTLDSDFKLLLQPKRGLFDCNVILCHGTTKVAKSLWPGAALVTSSLKLVLPELEFSVGLKNKFPIEVEDNNSSMSLNMNVFCPGKMTRKEEGGYDFKISPEGKIDICAGHFKILDNSFVVNSGSILLNKKFDFKPIIDLQATCKVKKHLVSLNLFGPMERPFMNFHSNTSLSHDQIATIIFSGQEDKAENKVMTIFPAFLVDQLNKQMSKERQPNKIIKRLGNALAIARNPTSSMKIIPCLIESKIEKLGAAISYSPSPRFYANLKKDILNKDCLIIDAEYLLGENSSINFSRNKHQTIKGELEFKFNF